MILTDLNQVMISTLMVQIGFSKKRTSVDLNEHFLRHLVLNTIRSYNAKYKESYGDMIICCDSTASWRREFFPYYKASRIKWRAESGLDWPAIFVVLNKIRDEIKEYLPYRTIQIVGLEADDIIATLATLASNRGEDVLILSSDKDFKQLASMPHIYQYSPRLGAMIKEKDPLAFLKLHIIKGEPARTGDGIPNILSADDSLITGLGKKNLSKAKIEKWMTMNPSEFCVTDDMKRNWIRNETLIDLSKLPEKYKQMVLDEYNTEWIKPRKADTLNYLMQKGMRNLISNIHEF